MKTSDVLNKAADLIEERGWSTGDGWNHEDGGPICLEGGILAAAGINFMTGNKYACPAYKAVAAYLADGGHGLPFRWNDSLSNGRVMAAIEVHDFSEPFDLDAVRAEADEWAKGEVIATLRACAVIEAARETAVAPSEVTA